MIIPFFLWVFFIYSENLLTQRMKQLKLILQRHIFKICLTIVLTLMENRYHHFIVSNFQYPQNVVIVIILHISVPHCSISFILYFSSPAQQKFVHQPYHVIYLLYFKISYISLVLIDWTPLSLLTIYCIHPSFHPYNPLKTSCCHLSRDA